MSNMGFVLHVFCIDILLLYEIRKVYFLKMKIEGLKLKWQQDIWEYNGQTVRRDEEIIDIDSQ